MVMIKSRSAIFIILISVLMGGFSIRNSQGAAQQPASERERRRALELLTKQIQDTQRNAEQKSSPAPTPQGAAPAAPQSGEPAPAGLPPIPVPRESGKVQLSYQNVDLYDFINQIAGTLGLSPLVIDPDVKGSVTIQSSAAMSREDILPLFSLILKNNNAALVKEGGIYQIVPISSALKRGIEVIEMLPPPEKSGPGQVPAKKPEATPPTTGKSPLPEARSAPAPSSARQAGPRAATGAAQPPGTDLSKAPRLATHVIRVEFVPVKDLIEPIKLFMTEGGVIMPYDRLNMLILTDYTDSAERVLQIIRMLDDSFLDPDLVEIVRIENNVSADLCEDLKKIFGSGGKDSPTGISFISLDRLNAIFIMAGSKRGLEEIKRWIKELDSATSRNIQTFVNPVKNSTASNIAMMLSALHGGDGTSSGPAEQGATPYSGGAVAGSQTGGTAGTFGSGASALSGRTGQSATTPFGSTSTFQGGGFTSGYQGGYMGGSFFTGGQTLGPRLNTAPTISSQILRGGVFSGLRDTVRLVVDDVNNTLIIVATQADYAFLLETIKKMDVLPRQAIIDARIFEVDLTDALSFGVSGVLQGTTTDPASHLTGGAIDAATGALSANTFAFVGNSREILLKLNALREKTKVRILEAPSVLALDGSVARIVVGSEIPYPGASFTSSEGSITQSVQYRDTGISLIVQPRISASGSVTLAITQEVSSPGAQTSSGPTFSKTSVETVLSVKDGETVAIAGLIRDSHSFVRGGVPLLSEIPILGSLFGVTNRTVTRSELIILITPHVIRTPEKFQEMTQELKDSLRNVRKWADEKEKEHVEDMEDARRERYDRDRKRLEKTEPESK